MTTTNSFQNEVTKRIVELAIGWGMSDLSESRFNKLLSKVLSEKKIYDRATFVFLRGTVRKKVTNALQVRSIETALESPQKNRNPIAVFLGISDEDLDEGTKHHEAQLRMRVPATDW